MASSCCEYPIEETVSGSEEYVKISIHDPIGEGYDYTRTLDITKFEYEGHDYIFMRIMNSDSYGSFLHDPNCPCHKQEKIIPENIETKTKFSWED